MRKIEKYYENTADANPNYIVKKFIELKDWARQCG